MKVYDLDTNLKAAKYELCKAEEALEETMQRPEFTPLDATTIQVVIQTPKREAEGLHVPWEDFKEVLEFLPLTTNLEHVYALDRQVFYTLFRLIYREKLDPM